MKKYSNILVGCTIASTVLIILYFAFGHFFIDMFRYNYGLAHRRNADSIKLTLQKSEINTIKMDAQYKWIDDPEFDPSNEDVVAISYPKELDPEVDQNQVFIQNDEELLNELSTYVKVSNEYNYRFFTFNCNKSKDGSYSVSFKKSNTQQFASSITRIEAYYIHRYTPPMGPLEFWIKGSFLQ